MDVGAEADVIGQVPAVVIGILVDDDLVGVPEPIVAVIEVRGRDGEIKAAEPEALAIAAGDAPDVAAAEAAVEVAVLPRMIEMETGVIAAGIVADPLAVGVDVRSFRMPLPVGVVATLRLLMLGLLMLRLLMLVGLAGDVVMFDGLGLRTRIGLGRWRAVTRNVAAADVALVVAAMFVLSESGSGTDQAKCEKA